MESNATLESPSAGKFAAPYPGAKEMPQWTTGELIKPPPFTWKNWFAMLGPGLVMGGAAIGGGEWLVGPKVTAVYGGALLWLATLSVLGQVIYNIEISRYTLYTGEPIFSGKFRTLPGPRFWLVAYLLFDFGSVFPYLAANAATPVATLIKGGVVPRPEEVASDFWLMKGLAYVIFLGALVPLLFGGKIYHSLRVVMTFKLVVVFGFLLLLAAFFSTPDTWIEIGTGFLKFGSVPVQVAADIPRVRGGNIDNIFVALAEGRGFPRIDFTLIGSIAALAAIAGSGGLSNTPVSNYTRDQGWGMGHHVGAIPSAIGGTNLALSHVGCVFAVDGESLPRWRKWYRHVMRDQLVVWLPACFIGLALPSMLSVQFLPYGTETGDWTAAVMTAGGVRDAVTAASGAGLGNFCWFMTIFCGFLVLAPTVSTSVDGIIRRWVDVFWTSSGRMRKMDTKAIKGVYVRVLVGFSIFGLVMLSLNPGKLIVYATMCFNIALGFSCWHTIVINSTLLPRELRPGWFVRIALSLSGVFFLLLGSLSVYQQAGPAVLAIILSAVAIALFLLISLARRTAAGK
ncbi:MAG: Nramp family divalent metal transporter [Verrucomicrobia bacterium]|nr:Nramp family divalent metal transporter [Verrucomicrobiota bacterium]